MLLINRRLIGKLFLVRVRFTVQRLNTLSKIALVEFGNVGLFKLILICQSN